MFGQFGNRPVDIEGDCKEIEISAANFMYFILIRDFASQAAFQLGN
jgi:hypothetical protein